MKSLLLHINRRIVKRSDCDTTEWDSNAPAFFHPSSRPAIHSWFHIPTCARGDTDLSMQLVMIFEKGVNVKLELQTGWRARSS